MDGLEANGLLRGYSHLLTGYIGSPSLLEAVVEVLQRLRKHNPGLTYVCDPVMGDNGALYVPPDLPAIYRASVVPLATVVCPNQFELEQLTERPAGSIATVEEALAAVDALHALGPETVIVSSLQLEGGAGGEGEGGDRSGSISVLGSTTARQAAGAPQRFRYELARRPGYFIGTGDVFAALTLAWVDKMPDNVHGAVGQVLASLQAVLERTAAAEGVAATCDEKTAAAWAARELRLIQSQADILDPPAAFLPSTADLVLG